MALAAGLKCWSALPCLGGNSQYIAADMQILWQLLRFRPLSAYSLSLRLALSLSCAHSLFLSSTSSLVDGTVQPAHRGRSAHAVAAAAAEAAGRDEGSPKEHQWRHVLTSCLFLLLPPPVSLFPSHTPVCLHARVPHPVPGRRTQGQGRVEEKGSQLQPVGRRYGPACMEPTG